MVATANGRAGQGLQIRLRQVAGMSNPRTITDPSKSSPSRPRCSRGVADRSSRGCCRVMSPGASNATQTDSHEVPVEIIDGPTIITKPDRRCIGIRLVTPFRGMFAVRDRLMDELYSWVDEQAIPYGHTFFRLHVVDMDGLMDVEVGVITDSAVHGDDRIRAGVLPAGR